MPKRSSMMALISAIAVLLASGIAAHGQPPDSIRIGYAISLSGPNATGAAITLLPNYRLWVKEVNAAGGILLTSIGKRVPIEVIEYDDHSNADDAVAAIQRLIVQDKVDFILPPWGTGLNLAVAPQLHAAGYPQLATTAGSDKVAELTKLWPNSFWLLGAMTPAVEAFVTTIERLRSEGKIGNKVAMVNVADQFGIGLTRAARRALQKHGFELV